MAPVKALGDPVKLGNIQTANRICVPPMVLYGHAGDDGMVTGAHIAHYERLARGGPGLIIQEATCVTREGRLSGSQLGIWSEDHVPGLRQITRAVHRENVPIVVQLHHGGVTATQGPRVCPSGYSYRVEKPGQPPQVFQGVALTIEEIEALRDAFIRGALRAKTAGYDGVELHGCHSYLLSQFLNRRVNVRTDRYGDGLVLVEEIFRGIRAAAGTDFTVGIRLGGFEPALEDGIAHAKALAEMGLDFLDVSYGFAGEMDIDAPGKAAFSPAVRAAGAIRKEVDIPVFAVEGIRTPEQAADILAETDVDMVDVGRSVLVDPDWPRKALTGQNPGRCLDCRTCQWRIQPERCPGRRILEKTT